MTTHVQKVPLRQLIIMLTHKVLNRLRFFPVTLVFMLLNAVMKWRELRRNLAYPAIGDATHAAGNVNASIMAWLAREHAAPPLKRLDACVRLPREGGADNAHDIVSTMLVFSRFRSLALYWDEAAFADDLSIWQRGPGGPAHPVSVSPAADGRQFADLSRAGVDALSLPVGVAREMETLLKREAGGGQVVCLNLPAGMDSLRAAVVAARPEARFYDFSVVPLSPAPAHYVCTARHGLTLHERFALVTSADAYVGCFDELGCMAVMLHRRTVIVAKEAPDGPVSELLGTVAWLPAHGEPRELAAEVLAHLEKPATAP